MRVRPTRCLPALARAVLIAAGCLLAVRDPTASTATRPQVPSPAPPASPSEPQSEPVFRGTTNFVLVDAYPHRDGKVVAGLTSQDFEVFEDGARQTIDRVEFVDVAAARADDRRPDPNGLNDMRAQAADPHTRVFVMFLDTLHTTVGESHAARAPLVTVLDRLIGPSDLFGVMTQDMQPQDLTLGRRSTTVADQLAQYWSWGERDRITYSRTNTGEQALTTCYHRIRTPGSGWPIWFVNDDGRQRPFDEVLIDRRREDEVLAALERLIAYVGQSRDARTAVLVITDGWLLSRPDLGLVNQAHDSVKLGVAGQLLVPRPGEVPLNAGGAQPAVNGLVSTELDPSVSSCIEEATRILQIDERTRFHGLAVNAAQNDVSFYPIAMSQLAVADVDQSAPNDASRLTARAAGLRTLAENTGGLALVGTNDLQAGIRRMVDELSAYYLIGYYSTNSHMDGRWRQIQVRMAHPGITVYARSGYRAPAAAAAPAPDPSAAAVDEALAALGRLRDSTDVFLNGTRVGDDLVVAVELSSRLAGQPEWTAGANAVVSVEDASGHPLGDAPVAIDAGARAALVHVPVGAGLGPWRLTARVSGAGATVSERGDIRVATGALLGDPLVYRATASLRAALQPSADFQFRRAERLHAEWPIVRPIDQRVARLLDRRGRPLPIPIAVTERAAADGPSVAIDLSIAPLADGDYVIELVAGREGTTERRLIGIRVVR